MTDNDIVKALECCICDECKSCPHDEETACVENLHQEAIDLINRQKAEIKSITEKFNCQQTVYTDLSKIIKDKNAVKERLEANLKEAFAEIEALKQINLHCKSEAFKEFAKFLVDKAENGIISIVDLPDYVREKVGES